MISRRLALSLGLGMLMLTGPASAQSVLDFPNWQAEEPGVSTWWKDLIAAYEQRNPGVTVKIQQIPFAQYVRQLTVRFAAGSPPDILHLPSRDFASFADQGWLMPIDDLLRGTDIAQAWPPLQEEMKWDNKTQGVLLMGYSSMLFYNEKRLSDAGVAAPKTPDQWLAALKATNDPGKGLFGLSSTTVEHPNIVVEMATWVIGTGADWLKGGRYSFTDPAVIKAVDLYRQSITFAPKGTNSATARQLFIDGKTAFLRDGPWVWGAVEKAPADIKPHLKVAALPFAVPTGGASNSLHIPAKIDARKKDAAWKFIQLAMTPEWQAKYALTGSPAARKNALSADQLAANPHLKVINEEAGKAQNLFPTVAAVRANYNDFAAHVTRAGLKLIASNEPTDKVMADLQRELERAVPLK